MKNPRAKRSTEKIAAALIGDYVFYRRIRTHSAVLFDDAQVPMNFQQECDFGYELTKK